VPRSACLCRAVLSSRSGGVESLASAGCTSSECCRCGSKNIARPLEYTLAPPSYRHCLEPFSTRVSVAGTLPQPQPHELNQQLPADEQSDVASVLSQQIALLKAHLNGEELSEPGFNSKAKQILYEALSELIVSNHLDEAAVTALKAQDIASIIASDKIDLAFVRNPINAAAVQLAPRIAAGDDEAARELLATVSALALASPETLRRQRAAALTLGRGSKPTCTVSACHTHSCS
jgi:hypothetical protein